MTWSQRFVYGASFLIQRKSGLNYSLGATQILRDVGTL